MNDRNSLWVHIKDSNYWVECRGTVEIYKGKQLIASVNDDGKISGVEYSDEEEELFRINERTTNNGPH